MADPVELMIDDLTDRYAKEPASDAFMRLYTDDERFGRVFASLHERLNGHFVRSTTGRGPLAITGPTTAGR